MKNPNSRSHYKFKKLPFIRPDLAGAPFVAPPRSGLGAKKGPLCAFLLPPLLLLAAFAGGSTAKAGDSIADADGTYVGTASTTFWQKSTGEYGGSIFRNGCLSTSSGRYAGQINANGSITRADGSYGGFVSNWDLDE